MHLRPMESCYSNPIPICVDRGDDLTISMAFSGRLVSGNFPNEVIQFSRNGDVSVSTLTLIIKTKHPRMACF